MGEVINYSVDEPVFVQFNFHIFEFRLSSRDCTENKFIIQICQHWHHKVLFGIAEYVYIHIYSLLIHSVTNNPGYIQYKVGLVYDKKRQRNISILQREATKK